MSHDTLEPVLTVAGDLATVTRDIGVRLVNCSASGCLLESRFRIEPGTIGSLRLPLRGLDVVDDVRVVRCQPVGTASAYRIGVEFIWSPDSPHSLRDAIARGLVGS